MRTVYYRHKTIKVPQSIEELLPRQYYRYLEIAMLAGQHTMPEIKARLKLLGLFLSLPVDVSLLPSSRWGEVLKLLDITDPFIKQQEDGCFSLELKTGINLLPVWDGFHGPGDMLNGVSFDSFCKCLGLIGRMKEGDESEREVLLREFGSILYTGKKDGGLPALLCLHSYILFVNVFDILRTEVLDIDGERLDLRILFKKEGKGRLDDHTGWTGIGLDIAENGVFGDYSSVKATPFWDVLIFLYRKKFEKLYSKK